MEQTNFDHKSAVVFLEKKTFYDSAWVPMRTVYVVWMVKYDSVEEVFKRYLGDDGKEYSSEPMIVAPGKTELKSVSFPDGKEFVDTATNLYLKVWELKGITFVP